MIGPGLKKLAKEHNLKIDQGMAYGVFYGYAVSFFEGSGWKELTVSCLFPDEQSKRELLADLSLGDLEDTYRITDLEFVEDGIYIRFYDTIGTMKKFRTFTEWFFPLLDKWGATKSDICTQCGTVISKGTWQIVGDKAVYLHESCVERLERKEERRVEAEEEEGRQSYLFGTLGAIVGAAIGAVVWGLVYYAGYFVSVVGLLIGILASKGYDIARGKQTKKKNIILVVVTVLAVVVGMLGAYALDLTIAINNGELEGWLVSDVPYLLIEIMKDNEFFTSTCSDLAMGLLFAFIGLRIVLKQVHKENKNFRPRKLGK